MERFHARVHPARRGAPASALYVLVVDSSPIRQQELWRQLGTIAGVRVAGMVCSLASAVRMVRRTRPDLVVSNLHLSGGNGLELARRIHALSRGVRVLVISQVGGEVRDVSLASGADAFVVDSGLASELRTEIRRLFPQRTSANDKSVPVRDLPIQRPAIRPEVPLSP